MRRSYSLIGVTLIAVFLSGIAIGQKSRTSSFSKYLAPANLTVLDYWIIWCCRLI
jgi:hypothetical protein